MNRKTFMKMIGVIPLIPAMSLSSEPISKKTTPKKEQSDTDRIFVDVTDDFFAYLQEHAGTVGFMYDRAYFPSVEYKCPPNYDSEFVSTQDGNLEVRMHARRFKTYYNQYNNLEKVFGGLVHELWVEYKDLVIRNPIKYASVIYQGEYAFVIYQVSYYKSTPPEKRLYNDDAIYQYETQMWMRYRRIPVDVLLFNKNLSMRNFYAAPFYK